MRSSRITRFEGAPPFIVEVAWLWDPLPAVRALVARLTQ
jgi:hypothetical protein